MRPKYRAGIYLRLSREDELTGESSSIGSQREVLVEYCGTHGISVVDEYVDDGFSGTNFDRPGFQRMLSDIEDGRLNTVIVKDFSRLGRNSSRTADLLDEYFPSHGIRFIAVLDGFDSLQAADDNSFLTTPFLLLFNEMYARDLSRKIKRSFQARQKNGDYVASFAPYGYAKSTEDKHKLVVDHTAAAVVRRIFEDAANDVTPKEIAKQLNAEGVPSPAVYRCIVRPWIDVNKISRYQEWTGGAIVKMLKNKVYLGITLAGKTKKISYKNPKSASVSRDEWIEVAGTHEPIVSQELFDSARRRNLSRSSERNKGFHNIFSGIAFCADCGKSMTLAPSRKKGIEYNLCCNNYKTYGAKKCSNHFIYYETLCSIVLNELRYFFNMNGSARSAVIAEVEKRDREREKRLRGSGIGIAAAEKERRCNEVGGLIKKLYEDFSVGRIPDKMFDMLLTNYEKEFSSLEREIAGLKREIKPGVGAEDNYERIPALLDGLAKIDELTPSLLKKFIDRIEVGQGVFVRDENGKKIKKQTVKIFYRFNGRFGE